jgi:hypothetical protein
MIAGIWFQEGKMKTKTILMMLGVLLIGSLAVISTSAQTPEYDDNILDQHIEDQVTCDTTISFEQIIDGVISSVGQRKTHCFTGTAGQWISIRMGNFYPSGFYAYLELYDPNNNRIAYSDYPDWQFLTAMLPLGGLYKIVVTGCGSSTGTYRLRLELGRKAARFDVNRDCVVDDADWQIITTQGIYGTSYPDGDFDLNGVLNAADLSTFILFLGSAARISCPIFLDAPFDYQGSNLLGLISGKGSIFDHQFPLYSSEGVTYSTTLVSFSGTQFDRANLVSGRCSGDWCYSGHPGYDFPLQNGTPVRPAASGTAYQLQRTDNGGYGVYVILKHANGYFTLYGHLQTGSIPSNWNVGESAPAVIGRVGNTGNSWGGHLHFGVYYDANGNGQPDIEAEAVDPFGWIPGRDYQTDPWNKLSRCLWSFGCSACVFANTTEGANLSSASGAVQVQIPAGASQEPLQIRLFDAPPPQPQGTLGSSGIAFVIQANRLDGSYVSSLILPVQLTIRYTAADISKLDPQTLQVYRLDTSTRSWVQISSSVDLGSQIVTAQTSELGLFALRGVYRQTIYLPVLLKRYAYGEQPTPTPGPLPDKFLFAIDAKAPVGQFNYPHGVAVAPDGTVYVADWFSYRIQRFSAIGQFLGTWGSQGSGDGQFNAPRGVAVATDGTVYVADSWNHRIQRFTATGGFLGKWGSYGSGDGQFSYPVGVAIAPDGTVYVADTSNHRIQRFTATGGFLGKWGSYGSGDGQFYNPDGVAIAPDGTVYVADSGNNRIQRFTATWCLL